jgi:hypothetical protein
MPQTRLRAEPLLGAFVVGLLLYPLSYFLLRATRVIVHYDHALIDGGHAVESRSQRINTLYRPLCRLEVGLRRLEAIARRSS